MPQCCLEIKTRDHSETLFLFLLPNPRQPPTTYTQFAGSAITTLPTLKMARRPARCYRYCKNKVRADSISRALKICAGYLGGGECASIHRQRPPHHDRNSTFILMRDMRGTGCGNFWGNFFFFLRSAVFADISLQHPALP